MTGGAAVEYTAHYVRNILDNHRGHFDVPFSNSDHGALVAAAAAAAATGVDSDDGSAESSSLSPHSSIYGPLTTRGVFYTGREAMEELSPRAPVAREQDRDPRDRPCDRSPLYDSEQQGRYDSGVSRSTLPPTRGKGPDSMSPIRQGLDYKRFLADKKLYHCHQCKYVTDRKNNLKRHVVTMHEKCSKVLECCELVFPNKAALREHVLSCHKNGYNCRVCGRSFCRKALLKRHVTVHSGQKDYICGICGYATSHKSNLDRHRRRHEQKAALPPHIALPGSAASPYHAAREHAYKPTPLCENDCFSMFMDMEERWKETFNELHKLSSLYTGVKPKFRASRYMFPNRLLFTHRDSQSEPTTVERPTTPEDEPSEMRKDTGEEDEKPEDSGELPRAPLPVRFRWRVAGKRSEKCSRRLVPALYRCHVCHVVCRTQLDLNEHSRGCVVSPLAPPPQRPLTIEARKRDKVRSHGARWL